MGAAVNVGQRVRIEIRRCALQRAEAAALAFAEDRYRVLSSDRLLDVPTESAGQLIERADSERWEIGEVVLRRSAPQLVLDVVVYDLDALPMVHAEGVSLALRALMEQLSRRRVTTLAMEAIGTAHGGLSAHEFAAALVESLKLAPQGLHLLLCGEEIELLEEILAVLEELVS